MRITIPEQPTLRNGEFSVVGYNLDSGKISLETNSDGSSSGKIQNEGDLQIGEDGIALIFKNNPVQRDF